MWLTYKILQFVNKIKKFTLLPWHQSKQTSLRNTKFLYMTLKYLFYYITWSFIYTLHEVLSYTTSNPSPNSIHFVLTDSIINNFNPLSMYLWDMITLISTSNFFKKYHFLSLLIWFKIYSVTIFYRLGPKFVSVKIRY